MKIFPVSQCGCASFFHRRGAERGLGTRRIEKVAAVLAIPLTPGPSPAWGEGGFNPGAEGLCFSVWTNCLLRYESPMPQRETMAASHFLLRQLVENTEAAKVKRTAQKSSAPFHGSFSDVVVELIVQKRMTGASYGCIARDLNHKGFNGRYGARWYSASVRACLMRNEIAVECE